MDIWGKLCAAAQEQYHPGDVSPFIYAHHVVCALESENGEIYTGFCIESCSGVMDLCAERRAVRARDRNGTGALSGSRWLGRVKSGSPSLPGIAFRDRPPYGGGSGMPCGACREFFLQLSDKNRNMQIMTDYDRRETVTLGELMPAWWGDERYENADGEAAK